MFKVLLAFFVNALAASAALTHLDNVNRLVDRPTLVLRQLHKARWRTDLPTTGLGILSDRLAAAGFQVANRDPGPDLRIGAKRLTPANISWRRHWRTADGQLWIDIVEFQDEASLAKTWEESRQVYSGFGRQDYWTFRTMQAPDGMHAIGGALQRGKHLIHAGLSVPFPIRAGQTPDNTQEELQAIQNLIDDLGRALEVIARAVIDPAYVTWIPSGVPREEESAGLRIASFARLWSEVRQNFVFLAQRPELDWDSVLELYLPRVAAAKSDDEYQQVIREVMALLRDGHTSVNFPSHSDRPLVFVQPIEGRPVVIAIGDTPELKASGIRPGWELVKVNGEPVDELLRKKIYPVIAASTPQERQDKAYFQLLEGPIDSRISGVFRDLDGAEKVVELVANGSRNSNAAPWYPKRRFEFRMLEGNIAYVALNSFGSEGIVKQFDEIFEQIRPARGLIIDVRENGGGSTGTGYSIIARLIDKATDQTSRWRTRLYRPSFRAWGQPEGWHEGEHSKIEPRGGAPYLGPVVVLTSSHTYSAAEDFLIPLRMLKRATIVGTPSGGSTGQPLIVQLHGGGTARICTKWDRFPDGTDFVGVGVIPDVRVEPTRRDLHEGRDPVLAKAVEILAGK